MTRAEKEKLEIIAKNQYKLYEAGKENIIKEIEPINAELEQTLYGAGNSIVDESKLIEKTVSSIGKLNLTNVSEIPHKIKVQLSSDTVTDFSSVKIKRTGANLIPFPYNSGGAGASQTMSGVTFTVNEDRSVAITGTFTGSIAYFGLCSIDLGNIYLNAIGKNSAADATGMYSVSRHLSYSATGKYITISIDSSLVPIGTVFNETLYPMCNAGSVTLPYEPYQEDTYTPSADGYIEIDRFSPNMRLTTDNADIKITATYYKSFGVNYEQLRFMSGYQQYGSRTDYQNGFAGAGWTKSIFTPIYDIKPAAAYMMFRYSLMKFDLVEHLESLDVALDFSQCTNMQYAFYGAQFTRLGVLDLRKSTSNAYILAYTSYLETIDKIIVTESTLFPATAFNNAKALKHITFEGEIGQDINFQWSTALSKASIINIFEHLSSTASGKTLTLSNEAVISAFGSIDNSEWTSLINTYQNWTINLV